MSIRSRALLAAALLFAAPASVEADGFGLSAITMGDDGITKPIAASGPPPSACPADGLDFTDACGTTQFMLGL